MPRLCSGSGLDCLCLGPPAVLLRLRIRQCQRPSCTAKRLEEIRAESRTASLPMLRASWNTLARLSASCRHKLRSRPNSQALPAPSRHIAAAISPEFAKIRSSLAYLPGCAANPALPWEETACWWWRRLCYCVVDCSLLLIGCW